ncbi:hypothetical protein CCMA1212_000512 [Trichoderma ghanense]|uniref:Uncharacterized protein n=1 Tax=Trichoderma ghanense TaxID=65468 RepID=A0ABY2HK93_9HYPO
MPSIRTTTSGTAIRPVIPKARRVNRAKQVNDFVEPELERALLGAPLDCLLGEEALLVLQVEDAFFHGLLDGELVDDYVDGLGEAVDAVDGLFFDELLIERKEPKTYGIPKRLNDDDPRRGSQVQPQAAALEAAQQHPRLVVLAQPPQALLARVVAHAAVVAREREAFLAQERLHQVQHRRELREDDELVLVGLGAQKLGELSDFGGGEERFFARGEVLVLLFFFFFFFVFFLLLLLVRGHSELASESSSETEMARLVLVERDFDFFSPSVCAAKLFVMSAMDSNESSSDDASSTDLYPFSFRATESDTTKLSRLLPLSSPSSSPSVSESSDPIESPPPSTFSSSSPPALPSRRAPRSLPETIQLPSSSSSSSSSLSMTALRFRFRRAFCLGFSSDSLALLLLNRPTTDAAVFSADPHAREQIGHRIDIGILLLRVPRLTLEQLRVVAGLPQTKQQRKGIGVADLFFHHPRHALVGTSFQLLIELALRRRQLSGNSDHLAVRMSEPADRGCALGRRHSARCERAINLQDLLCAPLHEAAQEAVKPSEGNVAFAALHGELNLLLPRLDVVAPAILGSEGAAGLGGLCIAILDGVCLVEDDSPPVKPKAAHLIIALRLSVFRDEDLVGRDDNVVLLQILGVFCPLRPVVYQHLEPLSADDPLLEFRLPLPDQCQRCNNEGRLVDARKVPLPAWLVLLWLLIEENEGYRLQRLAQSHVVGEQPALGHSSLFDGAKLAATHPIDALYLMGEQLHLETSHDAILGYDLGVLGRCVVLGLLLMRWRLFPIHLDALIVVALYASLQQGFQFLTSPPPYRGGGTIIEAEAVVVVDVAAEVDPTELNMGGGGAFRAWYVGALGPATGVSRWCSGRVF